MTPPLIEALGRLAGLSPAELAVVAATATTLAGQGGAASLPPVQPITRADDPLPSASWAVPVAPYTPRPSRPVQLATVGWALDGTVDPDLFASAAYRARVGPTVPVLAYVAGCEGLKTLAYRIGQAVWKPGLTEADAVTTRLSLLGAGRYGACVRQGGAWEEQPGFEVFVPAPLPLTRRRGGDSPVQAAARAIAVKRPASLPFRVLDRALNAALATANLNSWAATPAAAELCRRQGIDPALLDRYTPGVRGEPAPGRPQRATELTLIIPWAEADTLADALERIIAEHVMGKAPG